jgi:hypothetical protein
MDSAMTGIAAAVEPRMEQKKGGARFGYDPVRGTKIRLEKVKKPETKQEKKTRKQLEFWKQLQ